jgi:hypothetical protein
VKNRFSAKQKNRPLVDAVARRAMDSLLAQRLHHGQQQPDSGALAAGAGTAVTSNRQNMPAVRMKMLLLFAFPVFLLSCSVQKKLHRRAEMDLLKTDALRTAHVGISLFEPATNTYWYNYQGNRYFVPASNVKIATCYAALKYLGDSIIGLRYFETDTAVYIQPSGDPTLLHRAFKDQPVYRFLRGITKPIYYALPEWRSNVYGNGWAWDDYNDAYQPERSALPVYGNTITFRLEKEQKWVLKNDIPFFRRFVNELVEPLQPNIRIMRRKSENLWDVFPSGDSFNAVEIPFVTVRKSAPAGRHAASFLGRTGKACCRPAVSETAFPASRFGIAPHDARERQPFCRTKPADGKQ